MIRTLVLRNLRQQWKLFAALAGGMFSMALLMVFITSAFQAGPGIVQLYDQLPPVFRNIFGVQIEELTVTAMLGFGFQHPAVLAMAISFVLLTTTLPAAERQSGFLDLLLAHPLRRTSYISAILVTLVLGAIVLPMAQLSGTTLGLALLEFEAEPQWTTYLPCALVQSALLLAIGGMALLFATWASRRGTAVAWSVGLILLFFTIQAFSNLFEPFQRIRWISLFDYFQPIQMAISGPSLVDPVVLLGVFAATTAVSIRNFVRRDV